MASDGVAYTTVPGKIPVLMGKILEVGVPPKASYDWLSSIGLKSSNDRSLISVLRQINFIGTDGKPTQRWLDYRGANAKSVLGQAIQHGYATLYATYPDAHLRSNTDLGHVFATQSKAGKQTIDKTVATFKALAALADFDAAPNSAALTEASVTSSPAAAVADLTSTTRGAGTVTVNVNIQLTLPETTDSKVFDAFFKSMKKHLLSEEDS